MDNAQARQPVQDSRRGKEGKVRRERAWPGSLPAGVARFRYPLILILLLLPALLPLLRAGFFVSDDGRFHVYRMAALANAWQHGVLHPRLFPEFGFGYGQAVLNFYSPLSYWPGAALSLAGISPATAAQITLGLGFLLAALAAYGYGRYLWGAEAGMVAALVYTYFPYHLADAYTRGAIPEQFAFIFPPLILWAYTAAFREKRPLPPLLWGSLAWTGLVLTHNLTTLLMILVAVPHLLFLAAWTGRWRRLGAALGSLALAMALSAGYWLPVLAESQAVGIGGGPSLGYENHLLAPAQVLLRSLTYQYHNDNGLGVVYPLSWLTLGLMGAVLVLLLWRGGQQRLPAHWPVAAFHLAMAYAAVAMTTSPALALWHPLTPVLGHLQYPWRFLGIAALGLMGVAGLLPRLLPAIRPSIWVGGMALAVAAVALPGLTLQPLSLPAAETWTPDRMWREDAGAGQVGATWTGEFLPVTVQEQRWALGRSPEQPSSGPPLQPTPTVHLAQVGYASLTVQIDAGAAMPLVLHQFYLPGWTATSDGQPLTVRPGGTLGLATIEVPAGQHTVTTSFGPTLPRTWGVVLATLAALAWAVLAWRRGRPGSGLRPAAISMVVLALVLDLNGLGLGQRTWTPVPHQARLGDVALLVGHEASPARHAPALDVTLYWFALRQVDTNFRAFVHLVDQAGAVVSQQDGDPVGGFTPTTRWQPGEIVADRHRISLPPDLPAGTYELMAGLYEPERVQNLPVDPPAPDNRVDLGPITIGR